MPATPTLHFMRGKAGAGKSAIAAAVASENGALLIAEDVWLARLSGDRMKAFDDCIRCSHHLSKEDFDHVSSLFEAPEADEGFNVTVHGQ